VTTLLPPAGTSLRITAVDTGATSTTLVDDDQSPDCLLVQEPLGTGGVPVAALPAGSRLLLTWSTGAGRHELDATVVQVHRDRVTLWQLAAGGSTRTTQLRRYARASDSLTGELTRGRDRWPAVVADLSEGGARTLLKDAGGLAAGDSVLLYVTVEGERLQLPGRLLPFTPAQVGRTEVRLEFSQLGRSADVIRRRVLELQIRARSMRRRGATA
jgi:PilZ domain